LQKCKLHRRKKIFTLTSSVIFRCNRRRKLPQDRTGLDFNPKDLRVKPKPRGKQKYKNLERCPKIDTEKLCIEHYKNYKNYYWYM